MADINELMADLEAADKAGDSELANHIASLIREQEAPSRPTLTPEQIAAHQRTAGASAWRAEHPYLATGADVLQGAAETARGALNLLPGVDIPKNPYARTDTIASMVGGVADPVALGLGVAAAKPVSIVGRLFPNFLPKVVSNPIVQGAIAGAGAGAAVGGLQEEGSALGGAVMGGAFGTVIPTVARAGGLLRDISTGNAGDVRAGRIVRQLQEPYGTVMSLDPSLTTAQASRSRGGTSVSAEMAALGKQMEGRQGTPGFTKMTSQEAARTARLARVAGGSSQEAARTARERAKQFLNDDIDNLRVSGAENANMWTNEIVKLKEQSAAFRKQAEKEVERARKMTGAIPRAEDLGVRQATDQTMGVGSRLSGRYTYGGELAGKAEQEAARSAERSLAAGAEARNAEYMLERTAAHGFQELSTKPLITKIDRMMNTVGDRTNKVEVRALQALKQQLQDFSPKGVIDAYDLHGIRKNLNNLLADTFPGDDALQKRAGAILNKFKDDIDDAFTASGGNAMVRYFDKFSQGMDKIRQMELADAIRDMSDKKVIKLSEGDAIKKIEKIMGPGKFRREDIPDVMNAIGLSGKELKVNVDLDKAAKSAEEVVKDVIWKNLPKARLPNFFNWATTSGNLALSQVVNRLDRATIEALGRAAGNPIEAQRVMQTLPVADRQVILKAMQDARNLGVTGGMMTSVFDPARSEQQ